MAICRPVCTDFWLNEKVYGKFSKNDKLVFVYLLTNRSTEQLGIYTLPLHLMAMELEMPKEEIEVCIKNLENAGVIMYSYTTNEVAILNYNKYNIFRGGNATENCYKDMYKKVKDINLVKAVYEKMLITSKDDTRPIFSYALGKFQEYIVNAERENTSIRTIESISMDIKSIEEKRKIDKENNNIYSLQLFALQLESELCIFGEDINKISSTESIIPSQCFDEDILNKYISTLQSILYEIQNPYYE